MNLSIKILIKETENPFKKIQNSVPSLITLWLVLNQGERRSYISYGIFSFPKLT